MYICLDCKAQVEGFEIIPGDSTEYMGAVARRDVYVCPDCGSENYIDVNEIRWRIESILEDYELEFEDIVDIMEGK